MQPSREILSEGGEYIDTILAVLGFVGAIGAVASIVSLVLYLHDRKEK